ncbi:MAG: UMP kinase, partial [Planctomycetota bacterium]
GHPVSPPAPGAPLRAVPRGPQLLLKGTKVDGVYSSDPVEDATAVLFERLSYEEVLQRGLKVMDATAIAFCREHRLPIRVFNLLRPGMVRRAILEEDVGTLVCPADR